MGSIICAQNTVKDTYNPASYAGANATIFIQPQSSCVNDTALIRYARPDGGVEAVFGFVQSQYGAGTADFIIQGSSCGYSEKLRIAGNFVGIGTCTPCSTLDVYRIGSGATGTGDNLIVRGGNNNNLFGTNQIRFGYAGGIGYSHAIKSRHNSGGNAQNALDFFLWTTADCAETVGSKNVMTLESTGNVGMGTCSPNISGFTGTMLTVNGTGNYQGLEIATSGTARMTMLADTSGTLGYISTRQAGMSLVFEAGAASEKMRITSDGKVGVATIAPLKKLNVYGGNGDGIAIGRNCTNAGNYESAVLNFYPSSDTANKRNWSIASYFSADYNLDFLHSHTTTADPYCNLATSVMSLDGKNDRVGIGTTAPADKLHIIGADNGITICSSSANRPVFSLYNGSSLMLKLSANGVYGAIADNSGSDVMYFKGGCVSIGTSTPSYKLHVNGTFYAAGSSQDYKQSICNYNTDSCMFMKLKPVTYQYKEEYCHLGKELKSGTQIGLIAEEVAETYPELAILVNEAENKVVRNVDYEKLSVILLSEVQKLRKEVDDLKHK